MTKKTMPLHTRPRNNTTIQASCNLPWGRKHEPHYSQHCHSRKFSAKVIVHSILVNKCSLLMFTYTVTSSHTLLLTLRGLLCGRTVAVCSSGDPIQLYTWCIRAYSYPNGSHILSVASYAGIWPLYDYIALINPKKKTPLFAYRSTLARVSSKQCQLNSSALQTTL